MKNPRTYNEKLQWLKLHDRNPLYTVMVDKVKVKDYVAEKIGKSHIIPTLGVWEKADDVNFTMLPKRFVIKCNHNSGTGMYICRDKSTMDENEVRRGLALGLKENYYLHGREWPYKNVPPRIIAEQYMEDESGYELKDYKIFCFHGEPAIIEVDFDRFTDHHRNIYSTSWDLLDVEIGFPSNHNKKILKPVLLQEMLEMSRILSAGIPHVRTDFYIINDRIYFGEMTFFHGSGTEEFRPEAWNMKLGDLIKLY